MDKKCIQEVTRQLCHPEYGVSRNLKPFPMTLYSWKKCLETLYGWVNLGIHEKVAKMFLQLKIGEVIPSGSSNLDFYTFGFASTEIQKFLQYRAHSEKNYVLILNYYSFRKTIEIMLKGKSEEYKIMFYKSFKQIFSSCKEKTFWLHIPICENMKELFTIHNIGEVVVKDGTKRHRIDNDMGNKKVEWEDTPKDLENTTTTIDTMSSLMNNTHISSVKEMDDIDDIDNIDDIDDIDDNDMKDCIKESDDDIETDTTVKYDDYTYRIVMNNKSLLSFLEYSCRIHNIHITEDIFTRVGAYNDTLEELFGSLSI